MLRLRLRARKAKLLQSLTPLRNINTVKCHELFCSLAFSSLFLLPSLNAQFRPPAIPIPQPSATQANPNVKLRPKKVNGIDPADVEVTATTQEVEGALRHLRGKVKIETSDMVLYADEMDIDDETKDVHARGHIKFQHYYNGETLECERADYNLNTTKGTFYAVKGSSPAKIQARPGLLTSSNPFYFEGEWAERDEDRYILHNGFVTDCKLPRPWWRLRGPTFDIIPDDRAIARSATFYIRRFPLFYAPAFYKSLKKSPRKSGFLTPNIGNSSRRGKMIGIGYYWAINRSYDVLYRNQYFTERGFAHHLDFRGKVRPGTDFDAILYGVNDRGIKLGNQVRKEGGYLATLRGQSDLGDGWQARTEINYLSSFRFRQAFTESFTEAIFSEAHSIGYATKHWSTFGFNAIAERNENFQSTEPGDTIRIRKLPEVQFLSRERQISTRVLPLWFSFESRAGLLSRSQRLFQTSQFVDRIDVEPRVSTAFRWAGFQLMPSFFVRETQYGSSLIDGRVRGRDYLRSARGLTVDLVPPSLARIYSGPKWLGDKVKHVIEPRATFLYVNGITDFKRAIRFDETELMSNTTELQISLTNRIYAKKKDGAAEEILSWELWQSRYFDPTFGGAIVPNQRNVLASSVDLTGYTFFDQPRHYSPLVSALRFQRRVGIEWRADYDPLRGHVVNSGVTADARFANYFISLGHNQVRSGPALSAPSNQFRALLGIGNENRRGWNAGFSAYYDYRQAILQFATTQLTYNTDCCGISFQYRRFSFGTRNENQFRIAFAVSNIGTFGTLKRQERIF